MSFGLEVFDSEGSLTFRAGEDYTTAMRIVTVPLSIGNNQTKVFDFSYLGDVVFFEAITTSSGSPTVAILSPVGVNTVSIKSFDNPVGRIRVLVR